MKYFNTTGPCRAELHYLLPALPRLPEMRGLIDSQNYFVLHAARQSGKTTSMMALARELTAEGRYAAVVLIERLHEDRVRNVIERLLTGDTSIEQIPSDDLEYVRDLGLVTRQRPIAIANPIYREVIPRELTWTTAEFLPQETVWYVRPDGRLDMDKLLTEFQQFFRDNSEHWVERFDYKEAGPQLLMQSFLHRVVNGGGRIEREYGLGRGRTDLLVLWNHPGGVQRVVLELKLRRKTLEQTITEGLAQTFEYGERCNADEMHFVVFDRSKKPWSKKIFKRTRKYQGVTIKVWGM